MDQIVLLRNETAEVTERARQAELQRSALEAQLAQAQALSNQRQAEVERCDPTSFPPA